jgi:hypothetical protein
LEAVFLAAGGGVVEEKNRVAFIQEPSTMNSLVRALGMLLRLVGVSSPEDTRCKAKSSADAPSWRKPDEPESSDSQERHE